jgi:hypothetical protein
VSARKRRPRGGGSPGTPSGVPSAAPIQAQHVAAMPKWNWRTFPVYFAFAVGGFIGLYMGLIAGATENGALTAVVFGIWAVLLGFGLSRFTSMWLLSRGWTRQIGKRNRR